MILAVLDDLMFTSKIRSAAAAAGVTVTFARSREAALAAVRDQHPTFVILDLNNPRIDPLGLVTTWRNDAAAGAVTTVGYVSHVQADLIDAARTAGVTEVLARSGFVQRLPELLARDR